MSYDPKKSLKVLTMSLTLMKQSLQKTSPFLVTLCLKITMSISSLTPSHSIMLGQKEIKRFILILVLIFLFLYRGVLLLFISLADSALKHIISFNGILSGIRVSVWAGQHWPYLLNITSSIDALCLNFSPSSCFLLSKIQIIN